MKAIMTDQVVEYAIEWLSPAEMRGSVTIMGTGLFAKNKAFYYLELSAGLPGEQRGKVVSRTITTSDWREEKDDGRASHHEGVAGFRQIHPC
jgi:hypothetical protein